jgi:hypothetical protein
MIRASFAALAAMTLIACGSGPTSPTTIPPATSFVTGKVNPSEEGYAFVRVNLLGDLELTLVSLSSAENPQQTFNVPVRLSLGVYTSQTTTAEDGTQTTVASCTDFIAATVQPGFQVQLTSLVHPGDYCAKVTDVNGRLTGPAVFVVREKSS